VNIPFHHMLLLHMFLKPCLTIGPETEPMDWTLWNCKPKQVYPLSSGFSQVFGHCAIKLTNTDTYPTSYAEINSK
jgi:hypothetical protein